MKLTNLKSLVNTKNNLSFYIGSIFLFAVIVLFSFTIRAELITQKFFDPIRETRERNEVVIVGVDDKSLQVLGAWPFNRKVFADLTSKLNSLEVKSIAYDVIFLESRAGDDLFLKEVKASAVPVIFASKFSGDSYLESYFSSTTNLTKSAFAHIYPDDDGQVRAIPNNIYFKNNCLTSLSGSSFSLFTRKEVSCEDSSRVFFRYPEKIKTISLIDVLNGNVGKKELENKVIFVGSNTLDLEDHFVSVTGEKVPGVFVHASILTTLLNNDIDSFVARNISVILILLTALIVTYFAYRAKSFTKQLFFFLFILTFVFFLGYFAFQKNYILQIPTLLLTAFVFQGYTVIFRFVKEKKKSDYIQNVFSKYVHKDVLNELLKSGKEVTLGGEKRRISILFSDIRGFTTFSEKMTPTELTTLLNDYLSAMSPIILNNKGTIDKYIGDAIMAFWNAPLYTKEHETYAVLSAVLMQNKLKEFNKEKNADLAMGVGVHVGDVVVGNVGSSERINYTILGDTVNTTSRLEGLTKKYGVGIIATEEIKNCVKDKRIAFRKLDVITVKGKSEATTIYEATLSGEIKEEVITNYEKAFAYYEKSNFGLACEILNKQLDDKPSQILLDRIYFIKNTKDFTFDGVWHFDEK